VRVLGAGRVEQDSNGGCWAQGVCRGQSSNRGAPESFKFVYYESIKREPKIRGINKCRCDGRLQTKTKEFTRLPYTGLVLELEHLKIETRVIERKKKIVPKIVFFPLNYSVPRPTQCMGGAKLDQPSVRE
jgi:hypothetical protein